MTLAKDCPGYFGRGGIPPFIGILRRAYRDGVPVVLPAYKQPHPKSRLGRRASWLDPLLST